MNIHKNNPKQEGRTEKETLLEVRRGTNLSDVSGSRERGPGAEADTSQLGGRRDRGEGREGGTLPQNREGEPPD